MTYRATPGDDIYALPLSDRWLVFAPATWTAAIVNHTALGQLAQCLEPAHAAPTLEALDLWQTLTVAPPGGPGFPEVPDPAKLVIMPTRACNLACVYCDFGAGSAPLTVLDPAVARSLVEHVARDLRRRAEPMLRVHFFGGEPMVARRALERIVADTRTVCQREGLTPWFEITTNGVFPTAAAEFLGDEIDSVVVSIDGDEALHDAVRHRPDGGGSYAEVAATLRRLGRMPLELCLRTCVTERSAAAMPALAGRFCEAFSPSAIAFEMLAETDASREAGLAAPDPRVFARGLVEAERIASAYGVRVVHGPSEIVGPRTTSCPLGAGALMLWPDGEITGCYLDPGRWRARGLELSLGRVQPGGSVRVDTGRLARIETALADTPRCERCFCRYTCAGGCHVDQTPPGCALEYDGRCRAIRLITGSRLLARIGCAAEATALLSSEGAAEALALHADDRLGTWRKRV